MKNLQVEESIKRIPKEIVMAAMDSEIVEEKCHICNRPKTYMVKGDEKKLVIDCDCQFIVDIVNNKKKMKQRKLDHYFKQSLVNPDIEGASFKDSDVQLGNPDVSPKELAAYHQAWQFIDNFSLKKKQNQTLIFMGGTGTGKSYLSYCIAKELKDRGYTTLFIDIVELLAKLRSTYNDKSGESEHDIMTAIAEVDLLVLDDVGANKPSVWANEKLFDITNKRSGKNTIYTTNLTPDELKNEQTFELKRSYSRMAKNAQIIKMYGKDRRFNF